MQEFSHLHIVPFVHQTQTMSCGAAALVMVFGYYGIQADQDEMFARLAKPDRMANNVTQLSFGAHRDQALRVGLKAGVGTIDVTSPEKTFAELGFFVVRKGVPIIARQSFSTQEREAGHYRVVTGITQKSIIVNDPLQQSRHTEMDLSVFLDLWQPHGQVPGGTGIWIGREGMPEIGQ